MKQHHIPFPPNPRIKGEHEKSHGGGTDAAACRNRGGPYKHEHHNEKNSGTHHGMDIKDHKPRQAGGYRHEKGTLPFFQSSHMPHGFRIISFQQEIDHHPQRNQDSFHGKDKFAVERKPAPPMVP